VGADLFTKDLRDTLTQFAEADNFGSLIRPALKGIDEVRRVIDAKAFERNLFLHDVHARVRAVLQMADYLRPKYHVVVANPPYMGGKGMNGRLSSFLKSKFEFGKSDLMTAFLLRGAELTIASGFFALVTLDSWMFLSSSAKLRSKLLQEHWMELLSRRPYLQPRRRTFFFCWSTQQGWAIS
jgi:type I restriction-modification system DNA methylase subunit